MIIIGGGGGHKNYRIFIARLPYGPVPDNYNLLYTALKTEKDAISIEEEAIYGYVGEVIKAKIEPDLKVFTTSEIKLLAEIKEMFDEATASEISELTHKELGYTETDNSSLISFRYAEGLNI